MDDLRPHSRRRFFSESVSRVLGPLTDVIAQRLDRPQRAGSQPFLRPPGALADEQEFLKTCMRCGQCVEACPADAIVSLTPAQCEPAAVGTPAVFPSRQACVVCRELACMKVCPSGALRLVDHVGQIRMGLAELREPHCLRNRGQDCRICLEQCPLGRTAIDLDTDGRVSVGDPGCVGCGVCELYCPTTPKAIVVVGRAQA